MYFGLQWGGIEFIMIQKARCWSLICLLTLLQSAEAERDDCGCSTHLFLLLSVWASHSQAESSLLCKPSLEAPSETLPEMSPPGDSKSSYVNKEDSPSQHADSS